MPNNVRFFLGCKLLMGLCVMLLSAVPAMAAAPDWSGQGGYRLIVEVPPADLGERESDEMVAACQVDFAALLQEAGVAGHVDLGTLQVHRFDPETGKAEPFKPFASAVSDYDRPCRFEDAGVVEAHRARVGRASQTEDGRPRVVVRQRKARLFNRELDTDAGRIVWVHTQEGQAAAHYAIYFDVDQPGTPWGVSPAPWIGDADVLRRQTGQSLGGFAHFSATAGDLNGDGLFDLVAGVEKGDLMWFPNRGKPGAPAFLGCRLLMDEAGPMDTGWYGAPFVYDWNGDELPDLLVGTSGNVIVWWQNVGSRTAPAFRYRGFVQADGGRLEVPESPVAEDDNGIFARDYYNQPWVGDWNGDGLPDILTGGYTTGRVFLYLGTARDEQGVPQLTYAGPVEADGEPIDTTWAAAPSACDFNGDGAKDLVTGSWWWSGIPHAPEPGQVDYVMYYRNEASPAQPRLSREPLPREGAFPTGSIARPTAVDWNDDGLMDLLVSDSSGAVYVFLNVGTDSQPRWQMSDQGLTVPWGFAEGMDLTASAGDVDGDGQLEAIVGNALVAVRGSAYSPEMARMGQATVNGEPIHHPGPGYGDPYRYSILYDWDGDGHDDVLWGTQQGHIYLHRHTGEDGLYSFAEGERLQLTNGEPLRVGPPVVDSPEDTKDFTVLQGSRIVFTADDFDGDGIGDLLVTETYGNVWVFRNTRAGGTDTLAPGVKVGALPTRTQSLAALDWNQDGKPDLLAQGTAVEPGLLLLNQSEPGAPAIAAPQRPFDLPYMFWGPRFHGTDWNGDGDRDLIVRSEFFTFWAEHSFLEHGYRPASLVTFSPRGRQEDQP